MKVQFQPILEKLSGKIKDLVFVAKTRPLVDEKALTNPEVYIRSMPRRTAPTSIRQDNLNKAFKILTLKFRELKENSSAYETWKVEASRLQDQFNRHLNAYQLFISYFMALYTSTLGIDVQSNDLSNGISLNWQDRSTRSWFINSSTSFGAGSYGTGSYSR